MHILTLSGSLRKDSYNTALLRNLQAVKPPDWTLTLFDALANIPPFNPDIDETEQPESVTQLRQAVDQSSAIIISTPEYAHGVPGVLKNAIDWLVSAREIILKPVAVMTVSTSGLGGYRAQADLIKVLHAMNTNVVIEASLSIPFARSKFSADGRLIDSQSQQALQSSLLIIDAYLRQAQTGS